MLNVHSGILFAIICLCVVHSTTSSPPPLNTLASVVKSFESAELCDHNTDPKTWFDDKGALFISFKTERKKGEVADDLCNCMFNYINQNNWLVDPDFQCLFDKKYLTMTLFGAPTKDGLPPVDAPVASLAAVLQQFPTADLASHKCVSSSTLDKAGLTHLLLQCELTCDSPKPDDVCKKIVAYLNQKGWLGAIKTNCSSKRFDLKLEIVGK